MGPAAFVLRRECENVSRRDSVKEPVALKHLVHFQSEEQNVVLLGPILSMQKGGSVKQNTGYQLFI